MEKIPTLFERDPATNRRHVLDRVAPGCDWVTAGEGVATFKWDGTSVLVDDDGGLWRRRELKPEAAEPPGFVAAGPADPATGKRVGWMPCDRADRWHWETYDSALAEGSLPAGTYELVGPKVQGNPHGLDAHRLIRHGARVEGDTPRDFDGLRAWLGDPARGAGFEGVVWHHPDGRRAKIKARDFPRA